MNILDRYLAWWCERIGTRNVFIITLVKWFALGCLIAYFL